MTMTPRTASEVLQRLASKHADDPEVLEAVTLASKRLVLRPGYPMRSVIITSRGLIGPGMAEHAYGRPFSAFRPCWLEVDPSLWRVEEWFIGDELQPVGPLFTGGDFPTAMSGRDLIFKVRNLGPDIADFRAELVGYGYPHRWPTKRSPPRFLPREDE